MALYHDGYCRNQTVMKLNITQLVLKLFIKYQERNIKNVISSFCNRERIRNICNPLRKIAPCRITDDSR